MEMSMRIRATHNSDLSKGAVLACYIICKRSIEKCLLCSQSVAFSCSAVGYLQVACKILPCSDALRHWTRLVFPDLLFYAYVWIHQERILVYDILPKVSSAFKVLGMERPYLTSLLINFYYSQVLCLLIVFRPTQEAFWWQSTHTNYLTSMALTQSRSMRGNPWETYLRMYLTVLIITVDIY